VLGGLVLWAGFAWSRLTGRPMVDDERARTELRAEQAERFARLLRGRAGHGPAALPGGGPAFWADDSGRSNEP
jgi:hypothetical protein